MAAKEGDVHHELLQEEDGGVGTMGEGGGGTDETQGGGGCKIEGKGGQEATTRAAALKRSTRIRQRAVERDERDRDDAEERGGQSLRDTREFRLRGHAGW